MYRKFDQQLLTKLNDLYLWAYDWTGIYVGTVIFLSNAIVVAACISRGSTHSMWVGAIVLLCGVVIAGPRYYLQSLGPERYNKMVLATEGFTFHVRTFFLFFNLAFLVTDILARKSYLECAANISNMAMFFLLDLKIRDRQKKDFKLPKLATQGSSS